MCAHGTNADSIVSICLSQKARVHSADGHVTPLALCCFTGVLGNHILYLFMVLALDMEHTVRICHAVVAYIGLE